MISKSRRGSRLGGLVRYLFGSGRHEEHSAQRVVACSDPTWAGTASLDAATLRQLIAELDDPAVRHGDRTAAGYVYHVVVSIPAADGTLSDKQWEQAGQRFVNKLGFDEQVHWVAVNHGASTGGNDHLHLVANLIRDDGRVQPLPFDRMRRREACLELEEDFGLTATSPAGLGAGGLSRREVEQLRDGRVADVADLSRHRIATTVRAVAAGARSEPEFVQRLRGEGLVVRARVEKNNPQAVTGYSVALRSGDTDGRLVWYGGGTLGKDLRLPALREGWQQAPLQRVAAASAWTSPARLARKAAPQNVAAASTALATAGNILERTPLHDTLRWQQAVTSSAGLLAAAATASTNDPVRRELVRAWQAVNRAIPVNTTIGTVIAAGDGATLRGRADQNRIERPVAAWLQHLEPAGCDGGEVPILLAGASRVLIAARHTGGARDVRTRDLLIQAVQLAAQISRAIAARTESSAVQRRAAEATTRAATSATMLTRHTGWQFTKTSTEVLAASSTIKASEVAHTETSPATRAGPEPDNGFDPAPLT